MADAAGAPHVALVGAMGSGKTTIGRRVAAALGRPFVDNDELLQRATGVTAAALASRDGVDALHDAEARVVIEALRDDRPAVIAAAASTVVDAGVRAALRERAWVAWLHADPATLAARMPETAARPHLDADPFRLVMRQAEERDGLFAEVADAGFDTGRAGVEQVVADLLAALEAVRKET